MESEGFELGRCEWLAKSGDGLVNLECARSRYKFGLDVSVETLGLKFATFLETSLFLLI
jgi:hypothetical protein